LLRSLNKILSGDIILGLLSALLWREMGKIFLMSINFKMFVGFIAVLYLILVVQGKIKFILLIYFNEG